MELTDKFRPDGMSDRKLMVLWLRFLKEVGENMHTLPKEMRENEEISQAAELCEEGAFTPAELAAYENLIMEHRSPSREIGTAGILNVELPSRTNRIP